MGGIDTDPCTEAAFEPIIEARVNYSWEDRREDGLLLPWPGRVHCNPPGGLVLEFWRKALGSDAEQVMWVGFSIEQFAILIDADAHPLDFSCCILRKRVGFNRHDGYRGSPSHANYVCGLNVDHAAFEREFAPLGRVSAGKFSVVPAVL